MVDNGGSVADLLDWTDLRDGSVGGWDGPSIQYFRFLGFGDRLEPISFIRFGMWSSGQPDNLQLHAQIQVSVNLYRKYSYLGHNLFNPTGGQIDWRLVLGASCFGLGWGIGGLCPGPAIMQFAVFSVPVHAIWFPFLIIGMFIARKIEHYIT